MVVEWEDWGVLKDVGDWMREIYCGVCEIKGRGIDLGMVEGVVERDSRRV